MENNKEDEASSSSNPNPGRNTTNDRNRQTANLPENHPVSYPEYRSVFLPENRYPVLDPRYDGDSSLLAEWFDSLSLSVPRHHRPVGPAHESFLTSRAHSAARGQNGSLYPREFGFPYEDVYGRGSWANGPSLGLNQNGMFSPSDGLNWPSFGPNQNGMFSPSDGLNGPSLGPNQNGMFSPSDGLNGSLYRNDWVNGSRLEEPGHSSWPSPYLLYGPNGPGSNPLYGPSGHSPNHLYGPSGHSPNHLYGPSGHSPNHLYRPNPDRIQNSLYWPDGPSSSYSARPTQGSTRPNTSHDGQFRENMYLANGLTRNQDGLFIRPIGYEPGRVGSSRANGGPSAQNLNRDLKEFRGKIKLMAKNRDGSAFLKKKIEDGAKEDIELVFEEVKDDVAGLMVNYFGNTVVQKLFKVCGPEQISYVLSLLIRVKYRFAEICCDNHGSLAMEKLLQNLRTREQRCLIISTLRGIVLNLSKDQNGLKVVQYCILHFPENLDVLMNEIAGDCFGLATHKSGCVVLQNCLGRAAGEMMELLMSELGPHVLLLSEHQYGNYVVQYLLDLKDPGITGIILSWLAGNFVSLSMNKCSSNVVEKCLVIAREDEVLEIISEIMNSDNFRMVTQDPYGNYVIQKAMEVSQNMRQSDIKMRLENRILSLYGSLNTHPFGNRVVTKLKLHRTNNFG